MTIPRAERTALIGREGERARVVAHIERARLVTLTGPGGVGKTRLARHLARSLEPTYPRVLFADVTSAADAEDVLLGIGRAALHRLSGEDTRGRAERLARALDERPTLLVVDNFEQVVHAAEDSLGALLDSAAHLRIVVTSRVRLELAGEQVVEVPPLALADAITLLVERAREAGVTLAPSSESAARIVERVDRFPFAIELAAARLRVLSPSALLSRLDAVDRLHRSLYVDTLAGSAHEGRFDSVRASVEASIRLLPPDAFAALEQCAVFAGGFTLELAERVIALPSGGSVAAAIEALLDASLLRSQDSPAGPRLSLYETVRAVVASGGQKHGAGVRLAEAFCDREIDNEVLRLDHENLLAAWSHQLPDRTRGRLARTLLPLLSATGPQHKLIEVASRGADAAKRCGDAVTEFFIACIAFNAHGNRGDRVRAKEWVARMKACAPRSSDPDIELRLLRFESGYQRAHGDLDAASRLTDRVIARAEEPDVSDWSRSASLRMAAIVRVLEGRIGESLALQRRALTLARASGDRHLLFLSLFDLAAFGQIQGDLALAEELTSEAETLFASVMQASSIRICASLRATIARERREYERAAEIFRETIARADLEDEPVVCFVARVELATLEHERERNDAALRLLDEAAAIPLGRPGFDSWRVQVRARVLESIGDLDGAAHAFDEAASLARGKDIPQAAYVDADRAMFEIARRDLQSGVAHLEEAVARLHAMGDGRTLCIAASALACVHACGGDDQRASAALARAISTRARVTDPKLRELLAATEAFVRHRTPIAPSNALFRRLAQLIEAASSTTRARIVVTPGIERITFGEVSLDLGRRGPQRRLVARLVDARKSTPGTPLSVQELFAAGWPGDRARTESAALRVYGTIRQLRAAGLRDVLLTRDAGYLLDPSVDVVVAGTK